SHRQRLFPSARPSSHLRRRRQRFEHSFTECTTRRAARGASGARFERHFVGERTAKAERNSTARHVRFTRKVGRVRQHVSTFRNRDFATIDQIGHPLAAKTALIEWRVIRMYPNIRITPFL